MLETGRLSRFGLQSGVQLAGVLREFRHVLGGPQLADQPGGVPSGSGGELLALQQHHVCAAELAEVVREAGTDDPATDDDDLGLSGESAAHENCSRKRFDE